jgi:hypothetical protein
VIEHHGDNGSDVAKEQQRSDMIHETIKFNRMPATSSIILNKLVPHETKDERNALKRMTLFPTLVTRVESDEITDRAEIVEIEVPVIGSDFTRNGQDATVSDNNDDDDDDDAPSELEETHDGYVEINILPAKTTTIVSPTETTDFRDNDETTVESHQQTAPPHLGTSDMHAIESRLVDQYRYNYEDNMIDDNEDEYHSKDNNVVEEIKPKRYAFPFNVKILVNNDDQRRSCKGKRSCFQVNFAKSQQHHDIDREYLDEAADDDDDDLFFKSEPERAIQMKSRRAADDGFFNSFNGISLTPAPRNSFASSNSMRALKKPSFIDRLETESSLERSERVNKDLSNLMKFVAVWAHVDKFVSDRARSVIRRLAYMADEDYGDYVVGSRRRENNLKAIADNADEPFT